jgi:tetratricopeptide (TPR) repeat protein
MIYTFWDSKCGNVKFMNFISAKIRCGFKWNRRFGLALICLLTSVFAASQNNALDRARQALDAGDAAQAISILENYRHQRPAEAEVYNLLGIAYGRAGNDDQSLVMFKEFARLAPSNAGAYNNLGAAYLRKDNQDQAEAAFRHALRIRPQDINALYNLGALLNGKHKYSESRPLLARSFQQEHSSAIGYEAAVAAAGTGDRKAALRILNSLDPSKDPNAAPWFKLVGTLNFDEGNLADASKALEYATRLAPDDKEALYSLALVRLKSGQADQAVPLLDKVMDSLSESSRGVREGTLLASYGAYPQALVEFEQAITADPLSYEAAYNLAVLRLEHLKDAEGAGNAAQKALAIKNTGEVQDLFGDICETQTHYGDALNHYQEAVRLDPNNDKFAFDLGAELLLHENVDAAETVFQAAEKRFPQSSRIYLGLGTAEFMHGKTEDAVGAYLKAIDFDPEFEPAYLFLGEASSFSDARLVEVIAKLSYLRGKSPQSFGAQYYYAAALVKEMDRSRDVATAPQALAALKRASQLRPSDARVFYQFGELCRVQKRMAEAVPYYQKSSALDPNFPEPLYKLGQAYVRLGRQEEARKAFARHKEVMTKAETDVYHRASEIQSFVLKMRNPQ